MLAGFIGLGTMGGKMAANLQKAGYRLMVYDLRPEAAATHLAAGAVWAGSPSGSAEGDIETRHVRFWRLHRGTPQGVKAYTKGSGPPASKRKTV